MKKLLLASLVAGSAMFAVTASAKSDYFTVFPTYAMAEANCDTPDWISAYYNLNWVKVGYVCNHSADDN